MNISEVIILAGGFGTRLKGVLPDLPKCMAPIAGRPFLSYVISYFRKQGIQTFILALGYKHEVIKKYVSDDFSGINFKFSVENEPLGTGGAIKLACSHAVSDDVLVVNGDTMFMIDLAKLSLSHESNEADCTLALKPMKNFDRYGAVKLNDNFSVQSFSEKKFYTEGLINGGAYNDYLTQNRFSFRSGKNFCLAHCV